ncbi:ferrous iron transport protein B [Thaumasiovibrio subtropicus]|uniref:ferrous iron transport protein B n=1 Tax=Thaumasiovibrio subtropicus TaxID=1891207 RepID=UPI000B3547E2|nr:ferrous iron transport protein B [Thaumasiovibrio subtropicus]
MYEQKILLAGQQNAGKSTLFNRLTGARQHVANYPGVTVDKKVGVLSHQGKRFQLVDLPGTYSLTSFSLEERVARKALREERADTVLNILDAANLSRSMHLTLQLIEMGQPLVIALNMMDVAAKQGTHIDVEKLQTTLDLPVTACIGRTGKGVDNVANSLNTSRQSRFLLRYPDIETHIRATEALLTQIPSLGNKADAYSRWLALRLLENDQELLDSVDAECEAAWRASLAQIQNKAEAELEQSVSDYIIACRHQAVMHILETCVTEQNKTATATLSQKIDRLVLNRYCAPLCLLATVFFIYQCSIVWGYELTNYTWPYLASLREIVAALLPEAGFLHDPYLRSLGLWVIDSANTLLNYVPIFLILFALIAILEDSGYMARIAFIADKVLSKFGLHGQSTLPLILSGVFAGGCAVPGIMATKGIPDNRARMATIFTVPFMNCLAKVPLYTLLLGIFFDKNKALMMFYISTITIIAALLVAKLLTNTVLKKSETAPFVMELPRYHLPTLRSVATRAIERTWTYVRKVGTIVVAVSVVIFVLLQFPGVPEDQQAQYQQQAEQAVAIFQKSVVGTDYEAVLTQERLPQLINLYTDYKRAKLNAQGAETSKAVNATFAARDPELFQFVAPPRGDKVLKSIHRALRKLARTRKQIRLEMKEQQLENSMLGSFGRAIEPISQYAGFDWKINVALLSSFAARESSVATLGVLFQQDDESNEKLEQRIGGSEEFSAKGELSAVALILFFALYPPCLATVMMIRVQTGQYRWMLLAIALPSVIGFGVATLVFSLGTYFSLSGVQAMSGAYFTALILLLYLGFKRSKPLHKPEALTT